MIQQYSAPVRLEPARAWRTYLGGSRIDAIHGIAGGEDNHFPEEWIMSTIVARNVGREECVHEGMSFLEGHRLSLKDYIKADPQQALGNARSETTGVLVKIIDAAERLTVQVHPDKEQAMRLFNSRFGKTECWHVLGGRTIDGEPPAIYLGFKQGITRTEWQRCFHEQDNAAMLALMHRFDVLPGQTFLVQAGVPHAIGKGCLLIEIQEPTDYTIRVERITPTGLHIPDQACHQGLGFDLMFDCFSYGGVSRAEAEQRWKIPPQRIEETSCYHRSELVGYNHTPCFKLERYRVSHKVDINFDHQFCGLYVFAGSGLLTCNGTATPIQSGDQYFVPAGCSTISLEARADRPLVVFRFFGPRS